MAGFPNSTMGNDAAQDRASVDKQGHDDIVATVTVGAGAGGGASATVDGTDLRGIITINSGTTPAAGLVATLNFTKAFGKTPVVNLTAGDGLGGYIVSNTNPGTSSVGIWLSAAPPASTGGLKIHYTVTP